MSRIHQRASVVPANSRFVILARAASPEQDHEMRLDKSRADLTSTIAGVDGRAPLLECGHRHRLWHPLAMPADFPRRWVVTEALPVGSLTLGAGVEVRLDETDGVLQGCAGCEDFIVWSRFLVLSGEGVGQCVRVPGDRSLAIGNAGHPTTTGGSGGDRSGTEKRRIARGMTAMRRLSPVRPHAPLGHDASCPIHANADTPGEPLRVWITTRPDGKIAAGTRLRLDAVSHGGAYLHDGAWTATTRRFCVLNGPLAGACLEETEWWHQFDAPDRPRDSVAVPLSPA